jgi:hypothetical protein
MPMEASLEMGMHLDNSMLLGPLPKIAGGFLKVLNFRDFVMYIFVGTMTFVMEVIEMLI